MLIRQKDFELNTDSNIKALLPEINPDYNSSILFIDIETTGLARDTTILYLLGCGYYSGEINTSKNDEDKKEYNPETNGDCDNSFRIIQWFNDDGVSEKQILEEFSAYIRKLSERNNPVICTFNGENFDLPYLKRHFELNDLPNIIDDLPSLDLYRALRPYRKALGLSHSKQKDWEHFLGIDREDQYSGRQLIKVYKEYLISREEQLLELILLHNMEDVLHMSKLIDILSYQLMEKGMISFQSISADPDSDKDSCMAEEKLPDISWLKIDCLLKTPVPQKIAVSSSSTSHPGRIEAEEDRLTIRIPAAGGIMKHYYADYKNYYYLPEEDRAIHKSIGGYVDKDHRIKCKADNCYIKKEGIYLPGIKDTDLKLTSYQTGNRSKEFYYEFDELFGQDSKIIKEYLAAYVKIIIKK
ncbi:MAG: ribonuclease H-like domain-containing protein [Eubacterium sp.]|nr:ribonuclease H-like domain-containing protein [Eubacterium sp.]